MSAEQWPTEAAATAAVEAAARKLYEAHAGHARSALPPWDDLSPVAKIDLKAQVLPMVWAALEALPDPRYGAWQEGFEEGYDIHPGDPAVGDNPYPLEI